MRRIRRRRIITGLGGLLSASVLIGAAGAGQAGAVQLIRSDVEFILSQIRVAENHAAGGQLLGTGANQVSNPLFPYGLRTVDGTFNNLIPGQSRFGAADSTFPRLVSPFFPSGESRSFDPDGPGPETVGSPTSYGQRRGIVEDSRPRLVSNLIVDQTGNNPAAVEAAARNPGSRVTDHDGNPETPDLYELPNQTPDEALSASYNSWFTLFGQFFDHGLDLVTKGGAGTVLVPLRPDDPLIVGPDGTAGTADDPAKPPPPHLRFMVLTRATNLPGPDGISGDNPRTPVDESADDVQEHTNTTTPFVDQNQTYTSHPSHQVFLREYELRAGRPVPTGRLLDDTAAGGIGTWDDVKRQARALLGITLTDMDALNVPLLATDPYGRFLPAPNGFARIATASGFVNGTAGGTPVPTDALRTGHAFLDDIAHHAVPFGDHDNNPATPRRPLAPDADAATGDDGDPATYDNEMLDSHFITGDGRGNENIGLTAVHQVFHAEHNRIVEHLKSVISGTGDAAFIAQWQLSPGVWNGERLFQAARFTTEMQYQHLVFEEFARKVQPQVNVFAGYQTEIDPAISAEFAHVVYRFGHSMLNETVDRTNADGTRNDVRLIQAFLNPLEYYDGGSAGTLTPDEAAGAIARGMTRQRGNEIDEFVTEALRSNLLGLPLDLATINIARGRETGVPTLNQARRRFHATTSHAALRPYTSWSDFRRGIRHPESLVNFVAAYGTHPSVTAETTAQGRRRAAALLVLGGPDEPADRLDFVNGTGAWASGPDGVTTTGVDAIDFWMGGLAERQMPFGGLLGSTFNFVFETQMERLQDGDRFYYLTRLAGTNMLNQLEENSFAEIVMRNTETTAHLPHDVFSRPDLSLELQGVGTSGPVGDSPLSPDDESAHLVRTPDGTLQFTGGEHVLVGGTDAAERVRVDDGDDTVWGDGGADRIEGGAGNDALNGGAGADVVTDAFGDDNIKGGDGNDAINAGGGLDLILAGFGKDFTVGGSDPKETFAGPGDDMVIAGDSSDTVFGGEGDDWIEGGDQADLLQGGNGDPFQDDTQTGHDVITGDGGNDDYDAEGGDDVMVAGPGIERNEGMLGFDWVTHRGDPQAANADMAFTGLLPPDEDNVRDRFDLVEGLSGWNGRDVLRGDGATAAEMVGHELPNAAAINRIGGLQSALGGTGVRSFTGGNIILGGGGSDLIEGRGGNDHIDGDAWLDVQLRAPNPDTPSTTDTKLVDSMRPLQADVFAGRIDPGAITIVRSIRRGGGGSSIDTAEFSEPRENYEVTVSAADPTLVTVRHSDGALTDGTDTLRNIERLRFSDGTVEIVDIPSNTPAGGTVTISDTTPAELEELVATQAVTDADGVNLDTIRYSWQREEDDNVWTTVATGQRFTPGQGEVGTRLRVVATFEDGDGVIESVASSPTQEVANRNDEPTGAPVIDDTTPEVGQTISASTTRIADLDGLSDPGFEFQWQRTATTGGFEAIPGATAPTLVVTGDQLERRLRVAVRFRDDQGTVERVISVATAPVAAAPVAPPPPPPPPAVASTTAAAARPAVRPLALRSASVPATLDVASVAARGIPVTFTAPARTTTVRIRVSRGTAPAIVTRFVPATAGRQRISIRHGAIIRALRGGGRFRIELTPGTSRRSLGEATVRRLIVRL